MEGLRTKPTTAPTSGVPQSTSQTGGSQSGLFDRLARKAFGFLRNHFNFTRAWCVYFLLLGGFIIFAPYFLSSLSLQLGSVIFSVFALYLIMVTSNRELQRLTRQQSQVIVYELQSVGRELRNVASHLAEVVAVMQSVHDVMVEQSGVQRNMLEQERRERDAHIRRLRPNIDVSVRQSGGTFLLLDWRHYNLLIRNSGGDSEDLVVTTQDGRALGPMRLGRNQSASLDLGAVNQVPPETMVLIRMTCRDIELRQYSGATSFHITQADWITIPSALSE